MNATADIGQTRRRIGVCARAATIAAALSPLAAIAADEPFGYISEREPTGLTPETPPSPMLSLVDIAPVLLPYVNNAPAFGTPGTVLGDLGVRTQVTGDWGGRRTSLARRGYFFDAYTTGAFQRVDSGGVETGDSVWQNTQFSLNVDTGRAGLWPGGLLHFTLQARTGDSFEDTFTVGASVPTYYGLLLPGPDLDNSIYPSDYYLIQAISKEFSVILGTISGLFLPDQTLFGDAYRYAFTNFAFNKNPMFTNFYGPTAIAALGAWAPAPSLVVIGGVLDPYTKADNFWDDAFKDVNLYLQTIHTYNVGGLPGQFSLAGNWSDQPQTDLRNPLGPPLDESWFAIANFSQYLYVMDEPGSIREKLKSGQQLRGLGVFGRLGYAPEESNPIARHASLALYARGLFDARPIDSFGAGVYVNGISDDLKADADELGLGDVDDEVGLELFYDFAITPAVRFTSSYQRIWNPLLAQLEAGNDHADVFYARLNIAW
jgi:hypothetical protein